MFMRTDGPARIEYCQRLGDSWTQLYIRLEIPPYDQARFPQGREAEFIWNWLEQRGKLSTLIDALHGIERGDLAEFLSTPIGDSTEAPREPTELRICLSRQGGELLRRYFSSEHSLAEEHSPWEPEQAQDNDGLFNTLFATEEHTATPGVLADILGSDIDPEVTPLRLLLHADDERLLDSPWWNLSWRGMALVNSPLRPPERTAGWTVGFLASEHPDVMLRQHVLDTPCPVLLIAPQAPDISHHEQITLPLALGEPLERLWPKHAEPPALASTWEAAETMLHSQKPRIVEVLARVRRVADKVELLWESTDGDVVYRPLEDLATLWGSRPPELLLLNLIGLQAVGAACAAVVRNIPLTLLQCGLVEQAPEIRRTAIAFLQALLHSEDSVEPAWLASRHAHPQARVWVGCERFKVQHRESLPGQVSEPLLVLDRREQRSMALQALNELLDLPEQRVCCLIAYGNKSTLVDDFGQQLFSHLHANTDDDVLIRTLNLTLADTPHFTVQELLEALRRQLRLSEDTLLRDFFSHQQIQSADGRRQVLLLNWHTRGFGQQPELDESGLRSWMDFCADHLVQACPDTLHLLSCLKLEGDAQGFERVSTLVNTLSNSTRFPHEHCGLELLKHLDKVTRADLVRFLSDRKLNSCPPKLRQEIASLILKHSDDGDFKKTVALLRQAQVSSWHLLARELQQR